MMIISVLKILYFYTLNHFGIDWQRTCLYRCCQCGFGKHVCCLLEESVFWIDVSVGWCQDVCRVYVSGGWCQYVCLKCVSVGDVNMFAICAFLWDVVKMSAWNACFFMVSRFFSRCLLEMRGVFLDGVKMFAWNVCLLDFIKIFARCD